MPLLAQFLPYFIDQWKKRSFPRTEGWGHNFVKLHHAIHVILDMCRNGLMSNYHGNVVEYAHQPFTKTPAKQMQKRKDKIEYQSLNLTLEGDKVNRAYV